MSFLHRVSDERLSVASLEHVGELSQHLVDVVGEVLDLLELPEVRRPQHVNADFVDQI